MTTATVINSGNVARPNIRRRFSGAGTHDARVPRDASRNERRRWRPGDTDDTAVQQNVTPAIQATGAAPRGVGALTTGATTARGFMRQGVRQLTPNGVRDGVPIGCKCAIRVVRRGRRIG